MLYKYCKLSTITILFIYIFLNETYAKNNFYCTQQSLRTDGRVYQLTNAEPYIKSILDRILSLGQLQTNYNICSTSGMSNAVAFINSSGNKMIVYDSAFLDRMANVANEHHWGKVAILAHEIGHHVYRHTRGNGRETLKQSRFKELEADTFAGLVLGHLGASLSNSQALMRVLGSNGDDSGHTHPNKKKRVKAVTNGWLRACKDMGSNCNNPYKKNRKNTTHYNNSINSTPGYTTFINWAEQLKGKKITPSYCRQYSNLAVVQAKRNIKYHCGYKPYNADPAQQWSLNKNPQYSWCLKMSAYATQRETQFREKKISSCISKQ